TGTGVSGPVGTRRRSDDRLVPVTARTKASRSSGRSIVSTTAATSASIDLCSRAARRTSTRATGPRNRASSTSTPASTVALQPVGGGVLVPPATLVPIDAGVLLGCDGVPASGATTGRLGAETMVASDSVLLSGSAYSARMAARNAAAV